MDLSQRQVRSIHREQRLRNHLGHFTIFVRPNDQRPSPQDRLRSRRDEATSHRLWAQVAAEFYGLEGVETYSGRTEATAPNPRAVAAIQRCGLKIVAEDPTAANPRYSVTTSESSTPQVCFSKAYGDPPNPSKGYCAVMTCSQADDACPLVMGCDLRMPIRYEDPKVADDTEFESHRYDERCAQICSEMLYMMSLV